MNTKEIVLQKIQALSLGPLWTEKQYEESTLDQPHQETQILSPKRETLRLNIEKDAVSVDIKPKSKVLEALIQTLKKSYITYKFHPLVALFMEKSERYEIILVAKENHSIYCVFPDNFPFISYQSACDYLIAKHWDKFFYSEKVELEPPKGCFTSISRCGFTGVLLGPPNYHIYNDLLREHYEESLIGNYSWKEFLNGIKIEKDPEQVKNWLEYMKSGIRYRLKSNPNLCFINRLSAKKYLVKNCTDNVITQVSTFKLDADLVPNLPDPILKKIIQQELEKECKTPMRLSNWCRKRLHNVGFHIYKKGHCQNAVTYVCSIKRRIRDELTSFSDEMTQIIECIEHHQNLTLNFLMRVFFKVSDSEKDIESCVDPKKIFNFKRDILLLIRSGYVTQYEDGSIYISPKQSYASKQNQKKAREFIRSS